jgi:hypothetical protein
MPQKQRPLLITGWAASSLPAGESNEELLTSTSSVHRLAVGVANSCDLAKAMKKVRPKAGILYEAEAKLTTPV